MTTDDPDVGDTAANALRKTPSRELQLDFPPQPAEAGENSNNTSNNPQEISHDENSHHHDDDEGRTTCCVCIKDGRFTTFDALFIMGGMVMYIADLVTDLLVAVQYFREGYTLWSIMTFIFVLVPSLVLQYFSFRWFVSDLDDDQDHRRKGVMGRIWSWIEWLATHLLQLGAIKRRRKDNVLINFMTAAGQRFWSDMSESHSWTMDCMLSRCTCKMGMF